MFLVTPRPAVIEGWAFYRDSTDMNVFCFAKRGTPSNSVNASAVSSSIR
jgi:hypothetical protein